MQATFIVWLPIYIMLRKIKNRNSINAVIKKQARRLNDNRIKMTNMISWYNVMGKRVKSFEGEDIGKVENVRIAGWPI